MSGPLASIRADRGPAGALTLAISGEVDVSNADDVHRECVAHMDGEVHATLDLTGVRYIDSAGLRLLVALWQHAASTGGSLRVAAPQDGFVAELLAVTGLAEQLRGQ